jgi:hypothetical protein
MAWQSGAVERLRGLLSPDVLLRMLRLHVRGGWTCDSSGQGFWSKRRE